MLISANWIDLKAVSLFHQHKTPRTFYHVTIFNCPKFLVRATPLFVNLLKGICFMLLALILKSSTLIDKSDIFSSVDSSYSMSAKSNSLPLMPLWLGPRGIKKQQSRTINFMPHSKKNYNSICLVPQAKCWKWIKFYLKKENFI